MQGLESAKHQNMIKVISRFEELQEIFGQIIAENHKELIKENISEFKGSYDYYCLLIKELEDCIENYKELHESLQRHIFPYVRKMTTEAKNKKISR